MTEREMMELAAQYARNPAAPGPGPVLPVNGKYQEIHTLDKLLTAAGIPHTMERIYDGWRLCYPINIRRKVVMDAIEHGGSYGNQEDRLEIMGLLTKEERRKSEVLGHLTAAVVFERVKTDWERRKAMRRLKATKTSLYKLVAEFAPLPGIRRVDFTKSHRTPDYWLEWATGDGYAKAFFSAIMGRPLLSITVRDVDGRQLSYEVHNLSVDGLRDRGMVEEFTTAAERRRIERGADNGGLSPAT